MNVELPEPAATEALAARLAGRLPQQLAGWTILLEGELGAGKSTFARAFIRALGYDGTVPSPTYTLVEPYVLARGPVYHIDLYRLASEDELQFLGFEDLDEGCRLIEWPSRAPSLAGSADLRLELRFHGRARIGKLEPVSDRAADIVAGLESGPKT